METGNRIRVADPGMYNRVGVTRQWMAGLEGTVTKVNRKTVVVRFDHYPDEVWKVDSADCLLLSECAKVLLAKGAEQR